MVPLGYTCFISNSIFEFSLELLILGCQINGRKVLINPEGGGEDRKIRDLISQKQKIILQGVAGDDVYLAPE